MFWDYWRWKVELADYQHYLVSTQRPSNRYCNVRLHACIGRSAAIGWIHVQIPSYCTIVSTSVGDLWMNGSISFSDLHWVWWLALAMFINSAISVFYYLRIGVIMFLEIPEEGRRKPLPHGASIRMAIWICLVATIILGLSS